MSQYAHNEYSQSVALDIATNLEYLHAVCHSLHGMCLADTSASFSSNQVQNMLSRIMLGVGLVVDSLQESDGSHRRVVSELLALHRDVCVFAIINHGATHAYRLAQFLAQAEHTVAFAKQQLGTAIVLGVWQQPIGCGIDKTVGQLVYELSCANESARQHIWESLAWDILDKSSD